MQNYIRSDTDVDQAIPLLEKMLQIDPEKRCSAEEAIEERYLAPYHDPSDEPVAKEKFDWGFFDADLPADMWKTVLYSRGSGLSRVKRSTAMTSSLDIIDIGCIWRSFVSQVADYYYTY